MCLPRPCALPHEVVVAKPANIVFICHASKTVEPLLIVFGEEVRNNLIVTDPKDRGLFTKDQCKLINGIPFEPEDQDSIQDLLTITEQEKIYWGKRGINPEYIYELAEEGWEEMV